MEPLTSAWVLVGQRVGISENFLWSCCETKKYEPLRDEIRRVLRERDEKEEPTILDFLVTATIIDLKDRLEQLQQTSFQKEGRVGEAERQCYHINDADINTVDMLIYAAYNNN